MTDVSHAPPVSGDPGSGGPLSRAVAPGDGSPLRPSLPHWSSRTDVEQVELFTRGSLYVIGWLLLGSGARAAATRLDESRDVVVVVLAALALGVLGTMLVRIGISQHLAGSRRLPRRSLLLTFGIALALAGWAATLPVATAFPVALLGVGTLGWSAGCLFERRARWWLIALCAVLSLLATREPLLGLYGGVVAAFFLFTTSSSLWLLRIVSELDRARGTQAALAVAEERLRFSRDVHDVLGRHLSTIAVQAELAATLAHRGDERTGERILQVRGSAHDALREARELARGYRPLDLDHELEGAVSLLRSAGIQAQADLEGLPRAWHEPVARVVREAVTNVLRHSDATLVTISYADLVVEVADDGDARDAGSGSDGSGLASLREDLAPLGARLDAGPADTGFRVRLHLVGPEPAHDPSVATP